MFERIARLWGRTSAQSALKPPAGTAGVAVQASPDSDSQDDFRRGIELFNACEYERAARYFDAVIERRHDFPDAYYYLGLAHHQQGRFEEASDAFTMALCFSPKMAEAHLALARTEWKQGKTVDALGSVERAIEAGEHSAESHKLRGALLVEIGNVLAAVESYRRVIDLSPGDASAHASLGYLLFNDCAEYELGARHLEKALQIDPNNVLAQCNYTLVLLVHRGDLEATVQMCDRLLSSRPDLHEAKLNRALALLRLGRFDVAWDDYEARKIVRGNYVPRALSFPEWQGTDLTGKTLLIHAEQGVGDEIMFASCFNEVIDRAERCVIESSPRLRDLFVRSFPAATVVSDWAAAFRDDPGLGGDVAFQVAAGSLPRLLRRSWSEFPRHRGYLHPIPACVRHGGTDS